MKNLTQSAVVLFTLSLGWSAAVFAAPNDKRLVNEYGEPTGFGNRVNVIVPGTGGPNFSNSRPGTEGLYLVNPNYVDPRNFESIGTRHARIEAEMRGRVIIGPLEVLDSGPTGPMTPEALDAAKEEVTAQVLTRIQTTDKVMSSLKSQSKSLDENTRDRFKAALSEVAEQRQALRESLKTVRAINDDQWSNARVAVSVNYNNYVQSMHRAEEIVRSSNT